PEEARGDVHELLDLVARAAAPADHPEDHLCGRVELHDVSARYIAPIYLSTATQQGPASATCRRPGRPSRMIARPLAVFSPCSFDSMQRGTTTVRISLFAGTTSCECTSSVPATALPPRPAVIFAPMGRTNAAAGTLAPSLGAAPWDARQ